MPPKFDKRTPARSDKLNIRKGPPRIFVRPWDGVPSMLDGFAMLRGIESKYGKVKAFRFVRVCYFRFQPFTLTLEWTQP
jgi:hypothetical protein